MTHGNGSMTHGNGPTPLFSRSPSNLSVTIPNKFMAPAPIVNSVTGTTVLRLSAKTITPGSESPNRALSSSSIYPRPVKINRPMTTTGLSRAIPVLTQSITESTLTPVSSFGGKTLDEEYNHGRSSYARDTSSINVHTSMTNILNSVSNTSLTPTSLRTSNMGNGSNGIMNMSSSTSALFGPKSTTNIQSKPIKKLHHLTEMNNKYVPVRQAKKNFLLHETNDNTINNGDSRYKY